MDDLDKAISIIGGVTQLAMRIGVKPNVISNWRKRRVPAKHCPVIERFTSGVVQCEALRPDIDWTYLRTAPPHLLPGCSLIPIVSLYRRASADEKSGAKYGNGVTIKPSNSKNVIRESKRSPSPLPSVRAAGARTQDGRESPKRRCSMRALRA